MNLAFLDVETTGLSPFCGDRICEIGILLCVSTESLTEIKLKKSYSSLINPECNISPGASAINGITNDMVKNAPVFSKIAKTIIKLLKDNIVVCHNANFDINFLKKELELANTDMIDTKIIDTLYIARKYFNFPSNSLPNLAYYLGIKTKTYHRALSDAHLTKNILVYFIDKLNERNISKTEYIHDIKTKISQKPNRNNFIILPTLIEELINTSKKIHIKYISSDGELTERVIMPKEIVRENNYIYLVAYCYLRNSERMFRLDRVIEYKTD
jgi:DNA polymerase-3 subunit epsilon